MTDTNDKGEYALWDKGKLIGYAKMEMFNGKLVLASMLSTLKLMFADALKDGVTLILNRAYSTYGKQLEIRRINRKNFEADLTRRRLPFESKLKDEEFLKTASPGEFLPRTARPGESNHNDGTAVDIDTVDDNGKIRPAYGWLKKNAIKYGFIRTVPSETWHWELRPGQGMYSVVPESHPSWNA